MFFNFPNETNCDSPLEAAIRTKLHLIITDARK